MKRLNLLLFTTMMAVCSYAQDYVYTTDFSAEESGVTAMGNGQFVTTNEEGAIFSSYYKNDGSAKRTSYCLLPEDVLAHSATSKELCIAFWVRAQEDAQSNNYGYVPLFTAYTQAPRNGINSYPMMACQYAGILQVNCNGWCDFTDALNVAGQNAEYRFDHDWLKDYKWHYYTAVFTETNAKVYFDGEVKNEWNVDGNSNGQIISGLFENGAELKYVCLGGNQTWDWNDNDAPFDFTHVLITNKVMTPEAIMAQIKTDLGDHFDEYFASIKTVMSNKTDGKKYNLAGQQITTGYKGIVIGQGKKVLEK